VLILARHGPALGDVLAGLAHRLERKQLLHTRVREAPAERRVVHDAVAARERLVGLRGDERGTRHRLDPAGDEEVAVARDHGMTGADDRREPRRAETVDGDAADRLRQPRKQHGHAGHVAVVLARLVRAPEPHVLDLLGGNPGARDGLAHDERTEVVGPLAGERAAVASDGRPHCAQNHCANSASLPSRRATASRPRSPMSSVRSLTYIETNSSAVAASMPRPKPIAYCIAWSRLARPASIASRRTRDTSSRRSTSRRMPTSPSASGSTRFAVVSGPGVAISTACRSTSPRATTIGPYPSPNDAPCRSRRYRSATAGYAPAESAVTSSFPSSAHSFSVWMSETTGSSSSPRVSTVPASSAQTMNASSGSAEWPMRIVTPATLPLRQWQRPR